MSSVSPFRRSRRDSSSRRGPRTLERLLVGTVRRAGFWSAVVIPFVLLGLVLTNAATEQAGLFVTLLVANVLALRLGQGYNQP